MSLSYGSMLTLAAIVSAIGSVYFAGRLGIDRRKSALCFLAIGVAVIIGARALHLITHGGSEALQLATLRPVGFDLYGGLLAGAVAGFMVARISHVNPWKLADAAVVPLLVGIALVRVGCYHEGCCYGRATNLPWGVIPPLESQAGLAQLIRNPVNLVEPGRIHPTQLYELAGAVVAAIMAGLMLRRNTPVGMASIAGCLSFTAVRMLILPLRDFGTASHRYVAAHATLYLVILVGTAILVLWRGGEFARRAKRESG